MSHGLEYGPQESTGTNLVSWMRGPCGPCSPHPTSAVCTSTHRQIRGPPSCRGIAARSRSSRGARPAVWGLPLLDRIPFPLQADRVGLVVLGQGLLLLSEGDVVSQLSLCLRRPHAHVPRKRYHSRPMFLPVVPIRSGGPKELDTKSGVLSEALRGSRYAASSWGSGESRPYPASGRQGPRVGGPGCKR
jgi:hypothetical protein